MFWIEGFFVIFVIIFFIVIAVQTGNPRFDERQMLIQYKGYRYAAFTAIALNLVSAYIVSDQSIVTAPAIMFMIAFISILVFELYCIFRGAYFGIKGKWKSIAVWSAIIGIIDLYDAVTQITKGEFLQNGKVTLGSCSSLTLGIYFTAIAASILIQRIRERGSTQ